MFEWDVGDRYTAANRRLADECVLVLFGITGLVATTTAEKERTNRHQLPPLRLTAWASGTVFELE